MPEDILSGEFELNSNPEPKSSISDMEESIKNENPLPQIKKVVNKSNPHFYSSFDYYPKRIKFLDQEADEEIILIIRRRFVVNLPWILSGAFFALLPPFLFPIVTNALPIHAFTPIQTLITILFYYLVVFGFLLMKFTLWYFHIGIVTNKRIKDIDIHGILLKDVSETRINLIQDVKYQQIGLIPSLFNFGEVFIQTAGVEQNIQFDKAPQPANIARIIGDMLRKN